VIIARGHLLTLSLPHFRLVFAHVFVENENDLYLVLFRGGVSRTLVGRRVIELEHASSFLINHLVLGVVLAHQILGVFLRVAKPVLVVVLPWDGLEGRTGTQVVRCRRDVSAEVHRLKSEFLLNLYLFVHF
jgi:hypothetical protein